MRDVVLWLFKDGCGRSDVRASHPCLDIEIGLEATCAASVLRPLTFDTGWSCCLRYALVYLTRCSSGSDITPRVEKSASTTLWEYLLGILGYHRDVVSDLISMSGRNRASCTLLLLFFVVEIKFLAACMLGASTHSVQCIDVVGPGYPKSHRSVYGVVQTNKLMPTATTIEKMIYHPETDER